VLGGGAVIRPGAAPCLERGRVRPLVRSVSALGRSCRAVLRVPGEWGGLHPRAATCLPSISCRKKH